MTNLKCPVCGSALRVEHYFYKNLLYRSRLVCSNKGIIYCSYIKEFPLPVIFKEKKPMDRYVFAVVDTENWILHIAGIVSYNKLWNELDQEITVRTPSHFVLASQLDSFHQYIMRV